MNVFLILDQDADRPAKRFGPGAAALFKNRCRIGPFDRLGNARRLGQRARPDGLDRTGNSHRGVSCHVAGPCHDDRCLALRVRIADPVIDASAAKRLGQLAGPV